MKRNFHDEDFSSYDLTVLEQAPGPEKLDKPIFDLSLTFTKRIFISKVRSSNLYSHNPRLEVNSCQ